MRVFTRPMPRSRLLEFPSWSGVGQFTVFSGPLSEPVPFAGKSAPLRGADFWYARLYGRWLVGVATYATSAPQIQRQLSQPFAKRMYARHLAMNVSNSSAEPNSSATRSVHTRNCFMRTESIMKKFDVFVR